MKIADVISILSVLPQGEEILVFDPPGGERPSNPNLQPARLMRTFYNGLLLGTTVMPKGSQETENHGPTYAHWRYEYFDGWTL